MSANMKGWKDMDERDVEIQELRQKLAMYEKAMTADRLRDILRLLEDGGGELKRYSTRALIQELWERAGK